VGASYTLIDSEGPATDFSVVTLPAPYVGIDVHFRLFENLGLESGWGFFQPGFLMQYKNETLTTSRIRISTIPLRVKSWLKVGRRSHFFVAFGLIYDPISSLGSSSYKILGSNYRFDLSHSSSNGLLLSPSFGNVYTDKRKNLQEIELQAFIGNGYSMQANAAYFGQPENYRSFSSGGKTLALRYRYSFALKREKRS